MRRRSRRLIIGAGILGLTSCSSATEPPAGPPTLSIGRDTTLLVDESLASVVMAKDGRGRPITDPTLTWTSSAPGVASVDDSGRVTALTVGSAVLTAQMDTLEARTTITVVPQFTQLATGGTHSCGITGRGELYCWGISQHGELGSASTLRDCGAFFGPGIECSPIPVKAADLRAVALTAGEMHSCALDASGTAYCWGANFYGEIGSGSISDAITPTVVAGGFTFLQLVAGRMHTCGITTSHDAYCWGWDHAGQLGAGDVSSDRCVFFSNDPCSRVPRLVTGGHQWAQLSATDRATCGITTDGELYCWGLDVGGSDGLYCQTPTNFAGCTRTPILIEGSKTYTTSRIGNVHRCQQATDGTVECWGANYFGMLGDGTTDATWAPAPAAGGASYASFVASRNGTCGLTTDGQAQCWGRGAEGQVGNGATEDALSPVDVSGDVHWISLTSSGNSDHVCGISDAGRAYCWGWGLFGQLGNDSWLSSSSPSLVKLVRAATP